VKRVLKVNRPFERRRNGKDMSVSLDRIRRVQAIRPGLGPELEHRLREEGRIVGRSV